MNVQQGIQELRKKYDLDDRGVAGVLTDHLESTLQMPAVEKFLAEHSDDPRHLTSPQRCDLLVQFVTDHLDPARQRLTVGFIDLLLTHQEDPCGA